MLTLRLPSLLLLPLLLGGCAGSSVLSPYPSQALGWQRAMEQQLPADAKIVQALALRYPTGDAALEHFTVE